MLIPTADEAIEFAKKTGFRFRQCVLGNNKCGCAITLIGRMNGVDFTEPKKGEPNLVEEFIGELHKIISTSQIVRGFDSPQFSFPGQDDRELGRQIYLKAKENNLLG